jgi:hypothetical protein
VFLLFGTNEKIHCQEGKNNRDSPSSPKQVGSMNPPALNPSNQLIEAPSRAVVTPSNKSTLPNTNNIELSPALIKALQVLQLLPRRLLTLHRD